MSGAIESEGELVEVVIEVFHPTAEEERHHHPGDRAAQRVEILDIIEERHGSPQAFTEFAQLAAGSGANDY